MEERPKSSSAQLVASQKTCADRKQAFDDAVRKRGRFASEQCAVTAIREREAAMNGNCRSMAEPQHEALRSSTHKKHLLDEASDVLQFT
jgi:hypothetical protein